MIESDSIRGNITIIGAAPMIAGDLCMLIEALTNEFNSDEKEDIQRYMKYTIKDLGKEQILYNFLQFLEPVIK